MKKIAVGQLVQLLANASVIAGIVLLVVELQQNNRFLEAQVVVSQAEYRRAFDDRIIEDPNLAELLTRAQNGGDISAAESLRLRRIAYDVISGAEMQYTLIQSGNIQDDGTLLPMLQATLAKPDAFIPAEFGRAAWEESSAIRNPEFVKYVELNNVFRDVD